MTLQKSKTENFGEQELAKSRIIPVNIEAEQAILGALLRNNNDLNRVSDFLKAEHFFYEAHIKLYDAIIRENERGLIANPVTLKSQFDNDEHFEPFGGVKYLIDLVARSTSIINLETYARLIYDLNIRRDLINIGNDIVNIAHNEKHSDTGVKQIENAEQQLFNLASEGTSETGFQGLNVALAQAIERADLAQKRDEKFSGIPTRFTDLDGLLGGLQDSDLLILAGRPSMGKTALAINIAMNSCKSLADKNKAGEEKKAVGFFSLEMSSEQLATRMISMESGVSSASIRVGRLSDDDFGKIVQANKKIYDLPFFIDDTPALTISSIRTRARRLKRKHNLGVLIIDYLQLVRGSNKSSQDSRVQEVSEVTQGLKAIAKELNIPVIALSQLSRAVEQREDKRPQLSDLRESGSIEQDADIVMFIYREEYYEARKEPPEDSPKHAEWQERMESCMNKTEVIIAKQRNGPIGTAKLYFDGNTTQFKDLTENYDVID